MDQKSSANTGALTPGIQEDAGVKVAQAGSKGGARNAAPSDTSRLLDQNINTVEPSWDTQKRG